MHYYLSYAGTNYVLSAYYRNNRAGYRLLPIQTNNFNASSFPTLTQTEVKVRRSGAGQSNPTEVTTEGIVAKEAALPSTDQPGSFTLHTASGEEVAGWFYRRGSTVWLHLDGHTWTLTETKWEAEGAVESKLTAEMPGKVISVHAQQGQQVAKGATLLILEAMKMETPVRAPAPGQVSSLHVEAGELVEAGKVLAELEYE